MLNNKKILQNYFKSISYKFFKTIYGTVDGKTSHIDDEDIILTKVKIDENYYNIYNCKSCSFYTDRIHDTAIIKNNKIVDGPSFQLRNNTNVDCLKNSVFSKGTPRFRKKINGAVFSLLTGGGGNSNYWHWMFDVLPRLNIFEKKTLDPDYYLFPDLNTRFQKETLDLLDIKEKKRLSSRKLRHFYAKEIIITSHPYTILNDPNVDSLKIPIWISKYLNLKFLEKAITKSKIKNFPKKIYINRKDATSLRYIINKEEVENILSNYGYENLTMSDYSFVDQVALFYNANEIIGLHGAGFANIVFCKQGSKIIEIRPNSAGDVIKNLAEANNHIYYDISVMPKTINFNNQAGDIEINLEELKNKLKL